MIVTEEEARKKLCKKKEEMQISILTQDSGRYRGEISCDASNCMNWRWWDSATRNVLIRVKDGERVVEEGVDSKNRRGYCGLSGKPEEE